MPFESTMPGAFASEGSHVSSLLEALRLLVQAGADKKAAHVVIGDSADKHHIAIGDYGSGSCTCHPTAEDVVHLLKRRGLVQPSPSSGGIDTQVLRPNLSFCTHVLMELEEERAQNGP